MMPPVADLLPHAPPMVLIDEVLCWKAGEIKVKVTIDAASPFFITDTGIPVHIGLEYMAQACGAYAGLLAHEQGLPVRMGFLLGTRNFSAIIQWFRKGDVLIVTATEILRQETMGVLDCIITLEGKEVAKAQLTVYQPDDADEILRRP